MFDDFAQSLLSCTTLDGINAEFRKEAARHGYSMSSCALIASREPDSKPELLFRNWPTDWIRIRSQRGAAAKTFAASEASQIFGEGRRRMAPFTWSDISRQRALTTAERESNEILLAHGWRDGFLTPIHGPSGYLAIVGMASTERDLDLSPMRRAYLQMSAMLAHERGQALGKLVPAGQPADGLSARELECLRWVAAGKTDWEIGMILSISATTVKFHINGARRKLGARTRAQAVARLALSRLF